MCRKNLGDELALLGDDESLILERIAFPFLDQSGDVGLGEKELVEPRDLGKNLEVGEILRLKVFLGTFGGIACAAETLPEFLVPGIAPDHIDRIGLKQILQGEAALLGREVASGLGGNL